MCLDTCNFVNPTIAEIVGDTFLFYLCTIDRKSQIAGRASNNYSMFNNRDIYFK